MSNMHKVTLTADEQFFYEHAGYTHQADESANSGRVRGAILLAEAEKEGRRKGWYVTWEIDYDADTVPTEDYYVSGAAHWQVSLYDAHHHYLTGLGSIDLGFADSNSGKPKAPADDPYARVVAAELMYEAL